MRWEYTQLRFVPRGKSWTGEIEELWLDDRQLISRSHPQRDVSLVGLSLIHISEPTRPY